jgi:hypothetical protein
MTMPAAPLAYDCAGVPKKGAATVAEGRNDAAAGVEEPGVGPFVTGVLSPEPGVATLLIATTAPARQARTTTAITHDQMRRRVDDRRPRGGAGGREGNGPRDGTGLRSFLALRALRQLLFGAALRVRSAAEGSLITPGPEISPVISRMRRSNSSGPPGSAVGPGMRSRRLSHT